jgi:hypothetical protein
MANKYNELPEVYAPLTVADDDSTSLRHAQTSWGGVTTVQVNIHRNRITTSSMNDDRLRKVLTLTQQPS